MNGENRGDGAAPGTPATPDRWPVKWIVLLAVTIISVGLDQGTKHWAQTDLQYRPARTTVLVDGYLNLTYVRNPGAAWGFLARSKESFRRPFFIGVSLVAMSFIFYLFVRLERGQRLLLAALSLVMGGAFGNFIDRIRFNYVVDFIDFHVKRSFKWPTFNVADIAITVGVAFLFIEMFILPYLRRRHAPRQALPQLPTRADPIDEPPEREG